LVGAEVDAHGHPLVGAHGELQVDIHRLQMVGAGGFHECKAVESADAFQTCCKRPLKHTA